MNIEQSEEFVQNLHHFPGQQTVLEVQMKVMNQLRRTFLDLHCGKNEFEFNRDMEFSKNNYNEQ